MAETLGLLLKAGFQREAIVTSPTWPATTAAALTSLLPILDVQPNDGVEKASHHSTMQGYGPEGFDVLSKLPSDAPTLKLTYQGLETIWALALGYMAKRISGVVMPEALGSGAFRHLYELDHGLSTALAWDATADGFSGGELTAGQRKVRRGTFAIDMQVSVWEYLSSMVNAVTIRVDPDGASLTVELVAYSLNRTSGVNTSVTMAKLLPNVAPNVLFTDLAVRVGAYSASTPLSSADDVKCDNLSLRVENNLTAAPGPRTGLSPEEYEKNTDSRVTLTFTDPRHSNDVWQQRWSENTLLMADAKCTSERRIPGTSTSYALRVYFPACQVTNGELNSAGPRVPSDTVQLVGLVPSAAAAGQPVSKHLGALLLECVNGVSTHPLL